MSIGGQGSAVLGATSASAGVALLPNTSGNTLGMIVAVTAVSIGVVALVSHLVVRIVRARSR